MVGLRALAARQDGVRARPERGLGETEARGWVLPGRPWCHRTPILEHHWEAEVSTRLLVRVTHLSHVVGPPAFPVTRGRKESEVSSCSSGKNSGSSSDADGSAEFRLKIKSISKIFKCQEGPEIIFWIECGRGSVTPCYFNRNSSGSLYWTWICFTCDGGRGALLDPASAA